MNAGVHPCPKRRSDVRRTDAALARSSGFGTQKTVKARIRQSGTNKTVTNKTVRHK